MNIKTFRAESLQEGLRQISEKLGDNFRILHTRQTDETSFFGLRKHPFIEITVEETVKPENLHPSLEISHSPLDVLHLQDKPLQNNPSSLKPVQRNPSVLQRSMMAKLTETIRFAGGLTLKPNVCRIAAFIGTAGSGKTSLIVKIASYYKNKEKKKVGLLTADMFRIAAVEQLQKFGEILSVPVETISEPSRVPQAIRRLKECDLILIDTPAINLNVNIKGRERMQFVDETLRAAEADDIQLVLPATGSTEFLTETVRQFSVLQPTGISLTHLDEAAGMSALYPFLQNPFLKQQALPLYFISLGQNTAEDLESATADRLACLV